jgi:hypothetical protein
MIERFAQFARPVLDWDLVRRTRRNHGLEHATIHLLSKRVKQLSIAGRSSHNGFILMGEVPTEQVEVAVKDALERMKKGEHNLAVHPNCGTNLVTTGALTTLVALVGLGGRNRRVTGDRVSWVMTMMMMAVLFSQPLGMSLQRHITTEGDPGDLEFVSVTRREVRLPFTGGTMIMHNVVTRAG